MGEVCPWMALEVPDIARYRAGNAGVESVTVLESGMPGPQVVINALSHGNEICGALAVERLLRHGVRPQRGRLVLVFANVAAFRSFDSGRPYASRCVDEDFNRVWSDSVLDGGGDSVELRRARALRPFYRQADALLDLHSMTHPGAALTLCGRTSRGRSLACALGYPRWVIADSGHRAGPRLIDYGAFALSDEASDKVAILVECGQHWQTSSATVALAVSLRFLRHFEVIAPEVAAELMPAVEFGKPQVIEVTGVVTATGDRFAYVADCPGVSDGPAAGMKTVATAGTVIAYDQGLPVRTPHDECILIMPARTVRRGQTAVRLGRLIETR